MSRLLSGVTVPEQLYRRLDFVRDQGREKDLGEEAGPHLPGAKWHARERPRAEQRKNLVARGPHTHIRHTLVRACVNIYARTHARTYVDDFHLEIIGRSHQADVSIQEHEAIASAGDASRRRWLGRDPVRARARTRAKKKESPPIRARLESAVRARARAHTRMLCHLLILTSQEAHRPRRTHTHAHRTNTLVARCHRRRRRLARINSSAFSLSLFLSCERNDDPFGIFTTVVIAGGRATKHFVTSRSTVRS